MLCVPYIHKQKRKCTFKISDCAYTQQLHKAITRQDLHSRHYQKLCNAHLRLLIFLIRTHSNRTAPPEQHGSRTNYLELHFCCALQFVKGIWMYKVEDLGAMIMRRATCIHCLHASSVWGFTNSRWFNMFAQKWLLKK